MERLMQSIAVVIILANVSIEWTNGQPRALGFYLNGVTYTNGSSLLRTDIGEGDAALLCTTERVGCCRNESAGQFYFPGGTRVPIVGVDPGVYAYRYYTSRDDGFIGLNRRPSGAATGEFLCEIPDVYGTTAILVINSVDITLSVTAYGSNTVGDVYHLKCSATVTTGSEYQLNITWIDPLNSTLNYTEVTATPGRTTTIWLTFYPLSALDAGSYMCSATVGFAVNATTTEVIVQNPNFTALVVDGEDTPTFADSYSLDCNLTGAERLMGSNVTYSWIKNGNVVTGQSMMTLSFTPLSLSDAGDYNCQATITSDLLSEDITTNSTNSYTVALAIPDPIVAVTSDSINPTWPVGSVVTLNCTVYLHPAVDILVNVTTVWTGPDEFVVTNTAHAVMGSTTTYTSGVIVLLHGRNQSGDYNCTASVSSAHLFVNNSDAISGTTRIGIDVYLSLRGRVYANNSIISITDIGRSVSQLNNALQCNTDRQPCCATSPNRYGNWFFPNGNVVTYTTSFYTNRGDDGTVNLNRVHSNVMTPTGKFCCAVADATDTVQTLCIDIVDVVLTPYGSPMAGDPYYLQCSISGTSEITTFQWLEGQTDIRTQLNVDGSISVSSNFSVSVLQFSPLKASHGGYYTCRATVLGVVVEENTTVVVHLKAPDAVMISSPEGTIYVGSSPNLNCTVDLNQAVNVPVTVNAMWTGPVLTTITPTSPLMESLSRYIIMGIVDVARSGNYTCQATVSSSDSSHFTSGGGTMSASTTIIVDPLPSPTNLNVSPQSLSTSISLSWIQLQAADVVTGYEISYIYQINECIREGNTVPLSPIMVMLSNGSQRSYTIMDNPTNPVEEDSDYNITITAVNSVGRSAPSNLAFTTTAQAVPGVPPSLRTSSIDVTNITIQWDRVNCRERNGGTDSYRVVYYPTSTLNPRSIRIVTGTGDSDRMFTVTGLSPWTNYTFEVQAVNSPLGVHGLATVLSVSTAVPEDFGFLLAGQLYPNNSIVTLNDIGSRRSGPALYCLTPSTECCSSSIGTPNEATITREWYLPNGTQLSLADTAFSREQVSSAVRLYRNGGLSPIGVFRCEVPDVSGNIQNIYAGIYPPTHGSLSITSVLFDRNTTTLTCTSTGGPPTTVNWRKNGVLVNRSLYQQSQRVMDTETATYENILFSGDISNFVGVFTCEVTNARSVASDTVDLIGVSVVSEQFMVGQSATARCSSDAPATRMEWLTNGGVVECAASTKQLDLVIFLVNDSIHHQVYTCRVTGENGMTATQNFTIHVHVPSDAIAVSISRSRSGRTTAGMEYNMTCTVSRMIQGLVNSPTVTWTTEGMPVSDRNDIIVSTGTSSTSTLVFDPLRTSHGGRYYCTGSLSSPALESQLTVSLLKENTVQIPPPTISISGSSTPYNGTTFTLTGAIELHLSVDTDVLVTGTWSHRSRLLETTSPPYPSNLTFQPLATNSSGEYSLFVQVRAADGSMFIVESIVNATYDLIVQRLPFRPPAITRALHCTPPNDCCEMTTTLNCTANQVENLFSPPTVHWRDPNRIEVATSADSNPRMDLQTGQLIFSEITPANSGTYKCLAVINIPEALIVNHTDESTITVNANVPGVVQNLTCTSSSSSTELHFFWKLPKLVLEDEVIDYRVEVKRLLHRPGTREVVQSDVAGFNTVMKQTTVSDGLAGGVPYNITVKAVNLAGCGQERHIYCFTEEGEPPPPANVVVQRFDSTSIGVSWTKFTLVELKGLANYIVTYNIIIGSRKRQLGGTITVPWTENRVIISDLQPGAEYDITVRTSTAAGSSAPTGLSSEHGEFPASSGLDNSVVTIGACVAAVVTVLIISAAVVAIIALILRSRRAEFKPSQKRLEQPEAVMLNDITHASQENAVCKDVEVYHEYEIPPSDKYSQHYEDIHIGNRNVLAQLPKLENQSGDYEFTQCPAYVSIGNLKPAAPEHGNRQPSTTQET